MILSEDLSYFLKFNLVRDPFPLDVVDKILYLTPELNHRLELLVDRAKAGGPMQIVIAPPGGGKTVMAEYLASLKEPNWLVALVQGEPKLNTESLSLAILNRIFPDREFEKELAVGQLHKFLESATLNGKIPVFIIDDAEKLTPDCLQFILQLAGMRFNDSMYRIVLFANESINDLLDKPGLREKTEGVIKQLNLPPLSVEQTRAYIENRLSLSGEINRYPFSDFELERMARISAGLPGGINLLARQSMQEKCAQQPGQTSWTRRLLVVAACLLIVMTPVGYYYFTRQTNTGTSTAPVAALPAAKQDTVEKKVVQAPAKRIGPAKKSAVEQQLFDAQVSLNLPKTVNEPDMDADTDTVNSEPIATEDVTTTVIAQKPDTPASSVPTPDEAEQELYELSREQPIKVAREQGESTEQSAVSHIVYASENIYRLDTVPDVVKGINGPDWFRQQSPDLFVLQILSVSDFYNLEKMLKKIPELQGQLSGYTNYTPSGKPRYLLYYGLYQDRESAYAAVRDIPPPLQAVKPWPRDIKSIIDQLDNLTTRGYY